MAEQKSGQITDEKSLMKVDDQSVKKLQKGGDSRWDEFYSLDNDSSVNELDIHGNEGLPIISERSDDDDDDDDDDTISEAFKNSDIQLMGLGSGDMYEYLLTNRLCVIVPWWTTCKHMWNLCRFMYNYLCNKRTNDFNGDIHHTFGTDRHHYFPTSPFDVLYEDTSFARVASNNDSGGGGHATCGITTSNDLVAKQVLFANPYDFVPTDTTTTPNNGSWGDGGEVTDQSLQQERDCVSDVDSEKWFECDEGGDGEGFLALGWWDKCLLLLGLWKTV